MRANRRARLRGWLCALALLAPALVQAAEFVVESAATRLVEGVYLLDASIKYRFSDEALEALENGVPLTVAIDIQVQRKRWWWLNESVALLEQRYQLHYHALSDQYLLRNLNSGALYTFPSLISAVRRLGVLRGLPLLDAGLIEPGREYTVELRARLDIEALPAPLRPVAYLTPQWRLASDWYGWSLIR